MSFEFDNVRSPGWHTSDSPAASPGSPPPARRKGAGWTWLLVGCGLVSCVLAALCCGVGAWGIGLGLDAIAVELQDQLAENAKLRNELGDIHEVKMDLARSMNEDDEDTFVYRVEGSKGGGRLTVKHVTTDEGDEKILSASLRHDDGRVVQIIP